MHDTSLLNTIAVAFTAAWLLGLVTQRFGFSPIVGYLLAGVLIGPYTPGFIGDVHAAQQLAELGVILLMFGIGLHFHLKDLIAVQRVAIPGAVGQSLVATLLAIAIFSAFGMSVKAGGVIGMAMAVASTVVLIRVLLDANMLSTPSGHVAVGWLIVEDIFTVLLLVLIPVLGSASGATLLSTLGMAILKVGALVAIVLLAGSRIIPRILVMVARLRSNELFTLTVLAVSIAIAVGSYYFFGASMALGAFLAGMVVAQSPVSHQAAADALPLRDAFAVLFFVSVGMLFDPGFLIQQPLMIAAAIFIVMVAKPLTALVIVAILGYPVRTGLTVALALAQIGEFSFILSDLARKHGLMPEAGHNVLVAAAIISISFNPLIFRTLPRIEAWLKRHPLLWKLLNGRAERQASASNAQAIEKIASGETSSSPLTIIAGYGPVGRSVHRLLRDANQETIVIDLNMETISSLAAEGQVAIFGDASRHAILEQAGMARASHFVVALPETSDRAAVVTAARSMNPKARILVRARYIRERQDLEQAGATAAVFEEVEAALALARVVLAETGLHRQAADRKITDIRQQIIMDNISHIGTQRVRSVMVPWTRVRWLSNSADRESVLRQVSQERFSRWPVVDRPAGKPVGYLLVKDLLAHAANGDWLTLVRPLNPVRPDDSIEVVMRRMQDENESIYVVEDAGRPVGIVTLENIVEQVVGQIEDEYPHEAAASLLDAVLNGAIVLDLAAETGAAAIRELIGSIPEHRLPADVDSDEIIRLALERETRISANLGNGVAIPQAKIAGLEAPIVAFGRSKQGLMFSPSAPDSVHLVFLLLTPTEQPEKQLSLLKRLANLCHDTASVETLWHTSDMGTVMSILDSLGREPAETEEPAGAGIERNE